MIENKKIKILTISILCILTITIGLSYGYYLLNKVQENNNIAGSKCFNLEFTNEKNAINLDNMYPISDEEGRKLTPYSFTITNTCDMTASYTLSMEMLEGTTLNSKYVDVMVNNGEIKLLTSYDEASTVLTGSTESRILDKGLLSSNSSKDYSIRFWMDKDVEDIDSMNKTFQSKIVVDSTPINYDGQIVYDFDYTGGEQIFTAPVSGTYRLETWGAQGGDYDENFLGGIGGYSLGYIFIENSTKLYISTGGQGLPGNMYNTTPQYVGLGGYNGGGNGGLGTIFTDGKYYSAGTGGGGATSITNTLIGNGQLFNYENSIKNVLIVSGGGGGFSMHSAFGGSGGGFIGGEVSSILACEIATSYIAGATQISGYKFGQGQPGINQNNINSCGAEGRGGGGSGFYGGLSYNGEEKDADASSGSGGSGYIGNSLLTNKVMYCYNCEESNEESTKTISTTCSEETPTSYCAKKGNGYARITLVSIDE